MKIIYCFEHDIGYFADSVATITFDATDIQIGKVIVGTAFFGGDANFGWGCLIIYFDKET